MRGTVDPNSLLCDLKIEKTLRRIRQEIKVREQAQQQKEANHKMAEENHVRRTLGDYATPSAEGYSTSISRPLIQANNFELKPSLLQLV